MPLALSKVTLKVSFAMVSAVSLSWICPSVNAGMLLSSISGRLSSATSNANCSVATSWPASAHQQSSLVVKQMFRKHSSPGCTSAGAV